MSQRSVLFWLFSLLMVTPSEFAVVVGDEPVQASAGQDVVLPCHLEPPFNVSRLTVHWTWNDFTVHLYRHRKDDYNSQKEQFRNRTSLFHHEMSRGNISLKLTNVTEEDSGLYSCYLPKLKSQDNIGNVLLRVFRFRGVKMTPGDKKETGVNLTGAIGGGVGAVVSAVIAFYCYKRWRTQKGKEENDPQGDPPHSKVTSF